MHLDGDTKIPRLIDGQLITTKAEKKGSKGDATVATGEARDLAIMDFGSECSFGNH